MEEAAQRPEPPGMGSLTREPVRILVEGPSDEAIVRALLQAARYPEEQALVEHFGGKVALAVRVARLSPEDAARCAVLVDLDEPSVPDAVEHVRKQLGNPTVSIFCAVPAIEAWIFADGEAAEAGAEDPEALAILRRLGLPEEIPDPKSLAHRVFGPPRRWADVLSKIDVQRACARSPSLRTFLIGLGRLLGVGVEVAEESVSRSISRDTLAGLIAEVTPADAILWETSGGQVYTAADLRRHIEAGSEIGRQYASDLLRVSRDFLRRRAARGVGR
jgi:hypothetical protein